MDVFRGTVPAVPCRRLSGADCDLPVSADDETCPAGHELSTRPLPDDDLTVSGRPIRRARLAVGDEFETVSYEDDAAAVARIIDNPEELGVSVAAASSVAEHHGVDLERARAELRVLAVAALSAGAYRRSPRGFWTMAYKGMTIHTTPRPEAVLSYATRHYERLPSEVISGAPSRFGKRRQTPPGPPLPLVRGGPSPGGC